jgi:LCP family protein required for cell wall assembly
MSESTVSTPASEAPTPRRGAIARYGAGMLSALVPGLGHLVVGRRLRALVFFGPLAVLLVALAFLVATQPGVRLAAYLADPAIIGSILVAQFVVLGWRLIAVGSVILDARFLRLRPRDVLPIALLAVFVIAPQAGLAALTSTLRDSEAQIFQPATDEAQAPFPTFATPLPSIMPGGSIGQQPSPSPSPSSGPPRLTVLLLGMDSGVGRNTALTDTMIVASLDPVAKTVSMVSVPRDMVDVPLATGGVFNPKVNGLVSYVRHHPDEFPGYAGNGQAVLAGALGTLLGIHIDYYAQVNLGGFVALVNSVGGVDVDVEHALCDAAYNEYGYESSYFSIGAGHHHLNGDAALAYARIRKSAGESDFTRAARQQQVLLALRDRIVRGGILNDPIGFLKALGGTVQTNIPPSLLPDLAPLVADIDRSHLYEVVIRYPLVHPSAVPDPRGSIQIPDLVGILSLGATMFTTPGTVPDVKFLAPVPSKQAAGPAAAAPSCSLPRPSPTPTPVASPSSSPAASGSPGASSEPGPSSSEPGPSSSAGSSGSPQPDGSVEPSPSPTPS